MDMMCKPWKKMNKEEKAMFVHKKIKCGFCLFIFGLIWMYFSAPGEIVGNYIDGFISTITVAGLLMILYALVKKFSG
jgi:hypothetical protein